jgi:hypothetical protein
MVAWRYNIVLKALEAIRVNIQKAHMVKVRPPDSKYNEIAIMTVFRERHPLVVPGTWQELEMNGRI